MNANNDSLLAAIVSPLSIGDSTVLKAFAIAKACMMRADDEARLFVIPERCAGVGEPAAPATDG